MEQSSEGNRFANALDVIVKSAAINPTETDWWHEEKLEVMQFTGLLDKKGREIYEGDYATAGLEMGVGRLLQKTEGDVIYVGSCGTYCVMTPNSDGGHVGREIDRFRDIERPVGNIYENPELLVR